MKKNKVFEVVKDGLHKKGHKLMCNDESAIKRNIESGHWKQIDDPKK